jgi:[ribosomal protein S5]-alanine N-acetyltransferase
MRIAGHCRGTPARHHVVVPGMPTSIETARLAGRPPRPDDVPALLALYGSVEVAARMYPDGRPRTEAELGAGLEVDLAHWRAHAFGRYMWHERDTGEVVARCGPKLDLRGGRAELDMHWTVRADRHRRGFAAEAEEVVVQACFDTLGTESVTAVVRIDNAPSQALAEALGFAFERDVEHFGRPHRLYRRRRPA